jgi:hypothetical protein
MGLSRRKIQSSYTSLSYGRIAREKIQNVEKQLATQEQRKILLGFIKEVIPFLLKPLRIDILKSYN